MRRLIIRILTGTSLLLTSFSWASAQEWIGVNRDDFGNVVRGSYLTNEWFDNWYLGAGVGVQAAMSSINGTIPSPQMDVTILKWFTPCIGARFGYQGVSGKEHLDSYNPYQIAHSPLPYEGNLGEAGTLSYGLAYFHGDLVWCITNAIFGYKHTRFYNLNIYANTGLCRLYDNSEGQGFMSDNHDNEFAFGAGLLNNFRLTDRMYASLDLRHYSTASRYKTLHGVRTHHLVATAGLSYNIYKTYWNRAQTIIAENSASKADVIAAQQALENAKQEAVALEEKVAEKEAEIAVQEVVIQEYKKAEEAPLDNSKTVIEVSYDVLANKVDKADLVVYYYRNIDVLNFSELHHLDAYIQVKLKEDPNHVFYLTGSADKGTGTHERNTYLCRSRAYGVRDILINDYGVKKENIIIKATLISDKHLDGALDRCVIIESE